MDRIRKMKKRNIMLSTMEERIISNLDSEKYAKYKKVIEICKGKPPFSCLIWIDQNERTIEEVIEYAKKYKQQQENMSEER